MRAIASDVNARSSQDRQNSTTAAGKQRNKIASWHAWHVPLLPDGVASSRQFVLFIRSNLNQWRRATTCSIRCINLYRLPREFSNIS